MSPVDPQLGVLEPGEGEPFREMTFPAYRHLLALTPTTRHEDARNAPRIQPLAIGLFVGDRPAGLALSELPVESGRDPELLSLWVSPSLRGQGLGTLLTAATEREVARRGFERIRAVYTTGKASTTAVERIFTRLGWDQPTLRTVLVRFSVEDLDRIPWMRLRVRPGFEAIPWAEVTDTEKAALKASDAVTGWIAEDLRPWDFEADGFEPVTSMALRRHGAIVGWIINHALGPHFLRYTCSFIHPELGRRGLLITLYAESLRRMKGTSFTTGTLVAPAHHPAMVAFVRRRCAPHVGLTAETRGTSKKLTLPQVGSEDHDHSRSGTGQRDDGDHQGSAGHGQGTPAGADPKEEEP